MNQIIEENLLEDRIFRLRRGLARLHVISMPKTESDKVNAMLDYLIKGENIGYSSYYTYRICYNIYTIIRHNINTALLSPDEFTRLMAYKIQKDNVDISEPNYDTH